MPQVVADRYEIGDRLGSGGLSDVFVAYDRRLGRSVAIKFLRAGFGDQRARARFEREARVAASFNHPHTVALYDVGERDAQPYLVLELVDGPSLSQLLAARGRLEPAEAVGIADQVLDALGAAHSRQLVHRDVKPANILLTHDHVVKLADFGIAKAVADATGGVTMTGEVIGTPRYLSPEQVGGLRATPRSDLYAVGVVLYEMLAGAPPFSGETPIATALAHQREPVPSLASRRAGLDPSLVSAVERALEKDPARRFADAAEMRRALAGGEGTETVPLRVGIPAVAATSASDPTLAQPAARTQTITAAAPRPAETKGDAAVPRKWIARSVVVLVLLLTIVGVVAFLTDRADNGLSSSVPPTSAQSSTTVARSTTSSPATTVPITTTLPNTIDALIAALSANPDAYGSHANDLLSSLEQLQQAKGRKHVDDVTQHTIDDIERWIADGTLDPTIGTSALHLLQASTD